MATIPMNPKRENPDAARFRHLAQALREDAGAVMASKLPIYEDQPQLVDILLPSLGITLREGDVDERSLILAARVLRAWAERFEGGAEAFDDSELTERDREMYERGRGEALREVWTQGGIGELGVRGPVEVAEDLLRLGRSQSEGNVADRESYKLGHLQARREIWERGGSGDFSDRSSEEVADHLRGVATESQRSGARFALFELAATLRARGFKCVLEEEPKTSVKQLVERMATALREEKTRDRDEGGIEAIGGLLGWLRMRFTRLPEMKISNSFNDARAAVNEACEFIFAVMAQDRNDEREMYARGRGDVLDEIWQQSGLSGERGAQGPMQIAGRIQSITARAALWKKLAAEFRGRHVRALRAIDRHVKDAREERKMLRVLLGVPVGESPLDAIRELCVILGDHPGDDVREMAKNAKEEAFARGRASALDDVWQQSGLPAARDNRSAAQIAEIIRISEAKAALCEKQVADLRRRYTRATPVDEALQAALDAAVSRVQDILPFQIKPYALGEDPRALGVRILRLGFNAVWFARGKEPELADSDVTYDDHVAVHVGLVDVGHREVEEPRIFAAMNEVFWLLQSIFGMDRPFEVRDIAGEESLLTFAEVLPVYARAVVEEVQSLRAVLDGRGLPPIPEHLEASIRERAATQAALRIAAEEGRALAVEELKTELSRDIPEVQDRQPTLEEWEDLVSYCRGLRIRVKGFAETESLLQGEITRLREVIAQRDTENEELRGKLELSADEIAGLKKIGADPLSDGDLGCPTAERSAHAQAVAMRLRDLMVWVPAGSYEKLHTAACALRRALEDCARPASQGGEWGVEFSAAEVLGITRDRGVHVEETIRCLRSLCEAVERHGADGQGRIVDDPIVLAATKLVFALKDCQEDERFFAIDVAKLLP